MSQHGKYYHENKRFKKEKLMSINHIESAYFQCFISANIISVKNSILSIRLREGEQTTVKSTLHPSTSDSSS